MGLDFCDINDINTPLFTLHEKETDALSGVFNSFTQKTGLSIDLYGTTSLYVEHQILLTSLIKNSNVANFNPFLKFLKQTSDGNISLVLLGD